MCELETSIIDPQIIWVFVLPLFVFHWHYQKTIYFSFSSFSAYFTETPGLHVDPSCLISVILSNLNFWKYLFIYTVSIFSTSVQTSDYSSLVSASIVLLKLHWSRVPMISISLNPKDIFLLSFTFNSQY